VPFIVISKANAERDAEPAGTNKLGVLDNTGRKACAISVVPEFGEHVIDSPQWTAPAVLGTGAGGFEIATFTEFSSQDRHKHEKAIEIYTVLKGRMEIYIDDSGPYSLSAGDELVILPGTVHEIVQQKRRERKPGERFKLLVRVHVIGCYGAEDKYVQVEPAREWRRWSELTAEERSSCYKCSKRSGPIRN
jgi:mannose-6-phosphate isomerase-like protein (cupin superfamily)